VAIGKTSPKKGCQMNEIQGSDDWFKARLGKVTASKLIDVMTNGKGGAESLTRAKYRMDLACELLSNTKAESFTNDAMARGTELEPIARMFYEVKFNVVVQEVGFINHPFVLMSGASPDGLVGDDGLIEIKCPNRNTHGTTIATGDIPAKYMSQMQWQMACTGRQWCDYVSFCPEMMDGLELFVKRVPRDNEFIMKAEIEVGKFYQEVIDLITKIKGYKI
jgi:putative phage-type endonuclease